MYVCFLTRYGSMNAFLFRRNLSGSARCACGAESEDWKHVLVECSMYEDLRALNGCGVPEDGNVNVGRVLESYECFCKYECACEEKDECETNVCVECPVVVGVLQGYNPEAFRE